MSTVILSAKLDADMNQVAIESKLLAKFLTKLLDI